MTPHDLAAVTGSPIKAVLFDKDGTLLDFQKTWEPALRVAAEHAATGNPALARRLLAVGGMDPESGLVAADSLFAAASTAEIAEAFVATGSPFSVDVLTAALDRIFTAAVADAVVVTDLAAFFARLKARGLATGIASSDSEAAIRGLIARFGMEDLVDFVTGYDTGHGSKPEAGMLLAFAAAVGVAPQEVAMVGDSVHDMKMARAAGAGACYGVLTGAGTHASLTPEADGCLASILEVEALLLARAGV
ncbi:HAD family hydrolase [Methylobrevis pamukkalensis]|uniref:phosphoglycolate phosphatase n=1 Tax=Methylobrevis pamukkalensis TaxID=1439726 RepID=A0A1E3H3Q5_9HYPH|nr:HAD family hydrolase [Methylobrevis pamukkalensis]ODN70924.1 Phosphoglycolate phosphatase [Methylobrevis pamukkalensis]